MENTWLYHNTVEKFDIKMSPIIEVDIVLYLCR